MTTTFAAASKAAGPFARKATTETSRNENHGQLTSFVAYVSPAGCAEFPAASSSQWSCVCPTRPVGQFPSWDTLRKKRRRPAGRKDRDWILTQLRRAFYALFRLVNRVSMTVTVIKESQKSTSAASRRVSDVTRAHQPAPYHTWERRPSDVVAATAVPQR